MTVGLHVGIGQPKNYIDVVRQTVPKLNWMWVLANVIIMFVRNFVFCILLKKIVLGGIDRYCAADQINAKENQCPIST